MRWASLIFVGIAVLGCKDQPSEQRPATPAAATPAAPAVNAPAKPTLAAPEEFEAEQEDPSWADNTERAIKAVAPDLTDVDCRQRECRATLTAATQQELVAKADALSNDEGLRSTDARGVVLSAPQTIGGKLTMKIYIKYDR